ncbi:MAG TPA: hypothetical protein PKC18_13855, partial [Lacipirellulaceae bacterium]|nr:hypothetical protein [Lacipirellulaceae bacterium]
PACVGETCPPGPRPIQLRLFGWSVQRLYLGAYESLNDVIELAYRPWATFRRDFRQLEAQLMLDGELRTRRGLLADLLWPSLVAAVDARSRDPAMVADAQCARRVCGKPRPRGRWCE